MAYYKSATKSCLVMNKMNITRDIVELIKSFAYTETEKCVKQHKKHVLKPISSMWEDMDEDTIESYSGVRDGWWVKNIINIIGTYVNGTFYIKENLQINETSLICFNSKVCLKCGNYLEPVCMEKSNHYPYDILTIENAPHLICKCRLALFI